MVLCFSRLGSGRINKLAQSAAKSNIVSEGKQANTGQVSTNDTSENVQTSKRTEMNCLREESILSTNPFTTGPNLYNFGKSLPESLQSCNTDSGIDISSNTQSTFLSALKNDSVQTCKRNLVLNQTPMTEQNKSGNNCLKDQNHYPTKLSFLNPDNSHGTNFENKENASHSLHTVTTEIPNDPIRNLLIKNSEAVISGPPTKVSENINCFIASSKNNVRRVNTEPFRCNIFTPSIFDKAHLKKDDDDLSNTPLDLSSGDSLSIKNIFNRSTTATDKSIETIVSFDHLEKPSELEKNCIQGENNGSKQRNSSDAISSILPKFLAPVNKNKSPDLKVSDTSSNTKSTKTNDSNQLKDEFQNNLAISDEQNQKESRVTKHNSPNINENGSSILDHSKNESNKDYKLFNQSKDHPDSVFLNNLLLPTTKRVSPPSASILRSSTSKTTTEDRSGSLMSIHSNSEATSEDKENCYAHQSDSKNKSTNPSFLLTANIEQVKSSDLDILAQVPTTIVDSGLPKIENMDIDSVHGLATTDISPVTQDDNVIKQHYNHVETAMRQTLNEHFYSAPIGIQKAELDLHRTPQPEIINEGFQNQAPQEKINEAFARYLKPNYLEKPHLLQKPASEERVLPIQTHNNQYKTFLAPHHPSDPRMPSNDFPKSEVPGQSSNRASFSMNKSQCNNKMPPPPPRGRLSRGNTELFVNGKAYTLLSMLGKGGSSEVYQVILNKNQV